MHFFFNKNIKSTNFSFSKEEIQHFKALRIKSGDFFKVTNGNGLVITFKMLNPILFNIEYIEQEQIEQKQNIHIAIGVTKNTTRFEFFIEKAIEIGVKSIYPIMSQNSIRTNIKLDRLKKIMIVALKQSQKSFLPNINNIAPLNKVLVNINYKYKFVAHCNSNYKKSYFLNEIPLNDDYIIFIGPEGDFSEKEIELFHKNNFISVNLGNERLRTETAGIYACIMAQIKNQLV